MTQDDLFPFPVIDADRRVLSKGSIVARDESCASCKDFSCLAAPVGRVTVCPFGYGSFRIDSGETLVGVPLSDPPAHPAAYKKVRRANRELLVPSQMLKVAGDSAAASVKRSAQEAESERMQALKDMREGLDPADVVELLREEFLPVAAQFHDYANTAEQVRQNAELIQRRVDDGSLGKNAAEDIGEEVHSIEAAANLMIAKVRSALFLTKLDMPRDGEVVRMVNFHQLFTKFSKIYEQSFRSKGVQVVFEGEVRNKIELPSLHCDVIVQNLIDNAFKYAPSGSTCMVHFSEDSESVTFSVSNFGPEVSEDEMERIFDPNYRGRNARGSEGSGSGLSLVQAAVQRVYGTVEFHQDSSRRLEQSVFTTFTVSVPRS